MPGISLLAAKKFCSDAGGNLFSLIRLNSSPTSEPYLFIYDIKFSIWNENHKYISTHNILLVLLRLLWLKIGYSIPRITASKFGR
jgi:hypothetical protein